ACRSQESARALVARAQASGQLRPDGPALDITWLIEQFSRRAPGPLDSGGRAHYEKRWSYGAVPDPGPDRGPPR
nr:hypothetical protein [Actinomycetota bacterium]